MWKDRTPNDLGAVSIAVGNVTTDNALDDDDSNNEIMIFLEKSV